MTSSLAPFVAEARRYLSQEYPGKIARALDGLSRDDLWWRPNETSNSAGNLVLHLAGNVRQWVVHGLGGEPDTRERSAEFARRGGMDAREVFARLMSAVSDADRVLEDLDPATLHEPLTIQGMETTGMKALFHVVEHFSMHTGQILYLAKYRTGRDLGFYQVDAQGKVTGTNW